MYTFSQFKPASLSTDASLYLEKTNYANILDAFKLSYKSSGYYWQIGEIPNTPCWVLNLSVISSRLSELLTLIIPILSAENFPFQIVRDKAMADYSLNGHLGIRYLAKLIAIYPPSPEEAVRLAKRLITLTLSFKGPIIRTDRYLGSIVYACWGTHITIPFTLPPDVGWPFSEITTPNAAPNPKLLNYAYYPTRIIKADAKGDVIKALYFRKLWSIKPCVVKQGRELMFIDQAGRDIRDRLQWQYKLYSELATDLPFPKIFDHFELNGDAYLAMQYISGKSLTTYLSKLYLGGTWQSISPTKRTELIDHLLNILNIIKKLHSKGYIHRDITTENFLLDKKKKIWLIDVELMWSVNTGQPSPPFGQGTPGFISPEQQRNRIPTINEDIYAVGALMIAFFTNLYPVKFQQTSGKLLEKNLLFFLKNQSMATMISNCLNINPLQRPSLSTIESTIKSYRQEKTPPTPQKNHACQIVDQEKLRAIIQSAINGLVIPIAIDAEHRWISKMNVESTAIGNEQLSVTVQPGWYRGVAGPLWLIGLASQLGFDVSRCNNTYSQNWDYIRKSYFLKKSSNKTLYEGGAGIAMTLAVGFDSGILNKELYSVYLDQCFSEIAAVPTLAEGIAGRGIALLYSSRWLEPAKVDNYVSTYIRCLLSSQLPDGSWSAPHLAGRKDYNIYTLNHGIAGPIWFLLTYLQFRPDPAVESSTIKALEWLITKAKRKNKALSWSDDPWSTEKGDAGIIIVLLKAYNVLQKDQYRQLAESFLHSLPEQPVLMNYTLGSGLAGIGELYLDAFQILGNKVWHDRATWIVKLFLHTLYIETDNYACWLPDSQSDFTADLFMGNSGIIHFLMRYAYPDRLAHPFDPIR